MLYFPFSERTPARLPGRRLSPICLTTPNVKGLTPCHNHRFCKQVIEVTGAKVCSQNVRLRKREAIFTTIYFPCTRRPTRRGREASYRPLWSPATWEESLYQSDFIYLTREGLLQPGDVACNAFRSLLLLYEPAPHQLLFLFPSPFSFIPWKLVTANCCPSWPPWRCP